MQNVTERLAFEGNPTAWFPSRSSSQTVLRRLWDAYEGKFYPEDAAFMDALELACLAAQENGGGCSTEQDELPTVVTPADFPKLERALSCAADSVEKVASRLLLVDVPEIVVRDLQKGSISPTYPAVRGELGESVAELRGSFESVAASVAELASALRSFSSALRTARSEFTVAELQKKIAGQEALSAISQSTAACAAASSPTHSFNVGAGGPSMSTSFNVGAMIATCADSDTQIAVANMIESLREKASSESQKQVMGGVALAFSQALDLMAEASRNLSSSYANVNRLLTDIDGKRRSARRQLSRVLFLGNDSMGREFAVNRLMRARLNTTLERYKAARENAIRLAWLARRAIEERLGLDLSEMTSDMSLVRAPATWADEVCDLSGRNYDGTSDTAFSDYGGLLDRLRSGEIASYANIFVGDYVRMLENVVESYRLDYPFQDGRDVAIISLKNDIAKVFEPCPVAGYNQLRWSSDLTQRAAGTGGGWETECSGSGRCPSVVLEASSPFTGGVAHGGLEAAGSAFGSVPGYRMTLGCQPEAMGEDGFCQVGDAAGAGLAQTVPAAEPGLYVVSWYEKATGTQPQLRAVVTETDGYANELAPTEFISETEGSFLFSGWARTSAVFHNEHRQRLEVRFELAESPTAENPEPSAVWAAPQLEYVGPLAGSREVYPLPFFPTDSDLAAELPRCEDTDGSSFRSQANWTYGCEYYCPDGFGGTCGERPLERSLQRCFYETEFTISLPQIERGELMSSGSLALGNFNYRIDTLSLNLVGSNVRDCTGADQPSTCESSSFVPYSLRHGPPFRIRNYWGDVFSSSLYIGNIEHAKALAAERFLSNPVASSDQAALAEYTREEFRGRPLEGTYRLRLYDVDGLNWANLEDVQIALRYRYWTHFGN